MRPLVLVLLAGGATALAFSAGAQPNEDGARAILFDQPNFQGSSITVVRGSPDLDAQGFAQRAMSGHFDGDWIACDTPSYGGRCEPVNGDVPNFADIGLSHNLASVRQGRAGPTGGQASDDERAPGGHLAQASPSPTAPAGGDAYYDRGGPPASAQDAESSSGSSSAAAGDDYHDRGWGPSGGQRTEGGPGSSSASTSGDDYYVRGGSAGGQRTDGAPGSSSASTSSDGYYARGGAAGGQRAEGGSGSSSASTSGDDYYVRGGAAGGQRTDGASGSPSASTSGDAYYARGDAAGSQRTESSLGSPSPPSGGGDNYYVRQRAAGGSGAQPSQAAGYDDYERGGAGSGQRTDSGPGGSPAQGGGYGYYRGGVAAGGERAEVERGPLPAPAAQATIPVSQVLSGRSVVFFVRPQRSGADVDGQGRGAADQFCRDQGLGPALYYYDTNDRTLRDVLCRRD